MEPFGEYRADQRTAELGNDERRRVRVNRLLDRGESVHQLARIIDTGPIRSDRGRRREEKILISGALTLLTNAVIAYNTWKLPQTYREANHDRMGYQGIRLGQAH